MPRSLPTNRPPAVPRIAYCSPVNPAASGISDYSEELLPYLSQYADITLYIDAGLRPSNPQLARHLEVRPLHKLARDQRRRPYDSVLFHMGNSAAHAGIWRAAQQVPGVVVLHDFVLHHFMLYYTATQQRSVQPYVQMMEARYGAAGAHMAQLMIRSRFTEAAFDFPCCEPVVTAARAVIAHSAYVQARVAALRPDLPTAVVPMGVPLPSLRDQAAARAQLGLPPDAFVLASFGHLNAYKRLEPTLRAVLALRERLPAVRYVLVGSASPHYDVRGLVERMGLQDVVHITGFVPRDSFEAYVAAADICINLRHPTAGETSASLLRLLGAGRPTLVSATGSFTELPPAVAAQVDVNANEAELILAYCLWLAEQPALAAAMGAAARRFVAQQHSLEQAAQGYARVLAQLYRWPLLRRVRAAPLWLPGSGEPGSVADAPPVPAQARAVELPALPAAAQQRVAFVAQAAAELGVAEQDSALLPTVAGRMAELGLV